MAASDVEQDEHRLLPVVDGAAGGRVRDLSRHIAEHVAETRRQKTRSLLVRVSLACAGAAAVFAAAAAMGVGRQASTGSAATGLVSEQLVHTGAEQSCGHSEEGLDYIHQGEWLLLVDAIDAPDHCCSLCNGQERCHAWSWVRNASVLEGASDHQCWLKGGNLVQKVPKEGLVSGIKHLTTVKTEEPSAKTAPAETKKSSASASSSSSSSQKATTSEPTTTTEEPTTTTEEPTTVEPTTTTLENSCPGDDENGGCLQSKCCREPGSQCFSKNEFWAECMVDCTPGPNLLDEGGNDPWTCKPLGERAPGAPKQCAPTGENCAEQQCCSDLGMQCYAKNATYGTCKPACTPGVDMGDADDWKPWSCQEVGARTRAPASWVPKKCAHGPDNCAQAKCCGETGMQCYLQNPFYGQCKPGCTPTQWDKCTTVGPKTPKLATTIMSSKSKVGPWVQKRCSKKWDNCLDSECCAEVNTQCYTKDKTWATCEASCNSSLPDPSDNKTWECGTVGPRSWGLATKGYPSLFCFSLYMPEHYEGPLLRSVLKRNAGIFQCDGYDVFAAKNDTLGTTSDGITVKAVVIPKINVGVSQDGTAGNAKLFMAVWDKIIAGGRFRYYDWTIKVDPDAVLLPWRLREHMAPHVGEKVYVVNCNKFPSSPNFPMMYGALEVFSQSAMLAYAKSSWKCGTELPWKLWGEDYYMTHCMDYVGVGRISDFGVLGDNMCVGANCADESVASFHPFKTQEQWHKCWDTANGHPPPPPKPAAPMKRLRK